MPNFPQHRKALISLLNFGAHSTITINDPANDYTNVDAVATRIRWPETGANTTGTNFFKVFTTISAADFANERQRLIEIGSKDPSQRPGGFYISFQLRADANWDWTDNTKWATLETNIETILEECLLDVNAALGYRFVRGIILECEAYEGPTMDYDALVNKGGLTLAQMQALLETRGESLGDTIWGKDPLCEIIQSVGYLQCRQSIQDEPSNVVASARYGLLRNFLNGILNAIDAYPGAYHSEWFQKAYNNVRESQFILYRDHPEDGYTTLVDGTDYNTANYARHFYDYAPWPDDRSRKATTVAYTNATTISIGTDPGEMRMVVGETIYCVDAEGREQTRVITAVSGQTISFDEPLTIPQYTSIWPRTPAQLEQSIRNAARYGTGRRSILYFQNGNPHRAGSVTVPKWPPQMIRAVLAARAVAEEQSNVLANYRPHPLLKNSKMSLTDLMSMPPVATAPVVPEDTLVLDPTPRSLYVTTAGNVFAERIGSDTPELIAAANGQTITGPFRRVFAYRTTALGIVAQY